MAHYAKGANAERELIHLLYDRGFAVVRVAGSGKTSLPCPDIVALAPKVKLAFECKAWDKGSLSLAKPKIAEMRTWEENTGMTTMIAWRLSREGWYFIYLDELGEQAKSFTVTAKRAREINRRVEALL